MKRGDPIDQVTLLIGSAALSRDPAEPKVIGRAAIRREILHDCRCKRRGRLVCGGWLARQHPVSILRHSGDSRSAPARWASPNGACLGGGSRKLPISGARSRALAGPERYVWSHPEGQSVGSSAVMFERRFLLASLVQWRGECNVALRFAKSRTHALRFYLLNGCFCNYVGAYAQRALVCALTSRSLQHAAQRETQNGPWSFWPV